MISERLKKARTDNGISQAQVAGKLGITRQAYNHYETGKREPTLETLDKLSDIFNVSADYLLGKTDIKNNDRNLMGDLYIPEELEGVGVAFHKGEEGLTQDEVNKIAEYVKFIRSQRKKKED